MTDEQVTFIGEDDLVKVAGLEDYLLEIHFWSTEMLGYENQVSVDIPVNHTYQYLNCRAVLFLGQKILNGKCKYDAIVSWKPVGSSSPKASDKLRLARFISELPDADYLNQISHFDQLERWLHVKDYMLYVAKCLLAGSDEQPDNPLLRDLEEEKIEPFYHNRIWLSTRMYENLWSLVNLKWKQIKARLKRSKWRCPFTTGRELMEEIIKTEVDSEFSVCLKSFFEDKPHEISELFALSRKNLTTDLPSDRQKQLKKLVGKYATPNPWLERLIEVSRGIAKNDVLIYNMLATHDAHLDGICKSQQDASCKPELKSKYSPPETWKDGKRYLRSRHSNLWRT